MFRFGGDAVMKYSKQSGDGSRQYELVPTTQGPLYPPSEAMDQQGNFVVVGRINREGALGGSAEWGAALVAPSEAPSFGRHSPYTVVEELDLSDSERLREIVLHTLPLPLPANNYHMLFAPEQNPDAHSVTRPSVPFHLVRYPDERDIDGPKRLPPITLARWMAAKGNLTVRYSIDGGPAEFELVMSGLLPNSLYTVMTLKAWDLRPDNPTRPGPLGIPNVFVSSNDGFGYYKATLPDPFPQEGNRVINVIVLWMSEQRSYAGAIGHYGLGGDVHAQLKLQSNSFYDINSA